MNISKSESISNLAAAFVNAKAGFARPKKDAINPVLNNKYADLASCAEACEGALATAGLAVMQFPGHFADGNLSLSTMLVHVSGEWIAGEMSIPLGEPIELKSGKLQSRYDPQGAGSAITYARRYGLCAILGLCPADDTDGQFPWPAEQPSKPDRNGLPCKEQCISKDQWAQIHAACKQSGCLEMRLLGHFQVGRPRDLPAMYFDDALRLATNPTSDLKTALQANGALVPAASCETRQQAAD